MSGYAVPTTSVGSNSAPPWSPKQLSVTSAVGTRPRPRPLAQIDGLTTDVMGSSYFQHHPDPDAPGYTDDHTLAGIDGNLPVVRKAVSVPVDTTGRHGLVSRHGILHGRDLTYGAQTTSTKALVLRGALVERLAAPADERARRERRQTDGRLMKLTGFDENGRLRDTRCLDEVAMLRADLDSDVYELLFNRSLSESDVMAAAVRRLRERRLHRDSFRVLDVGANRYAWSFRLPSGHHLGSSHEMTNTTRPVSSVQLTWDDPEVPEAARRGRTPTGGRRLATALRRHLTGRFSRTSPDGGA